MCARTHLTTLRNTLKLIEGIRSANQYVLPRPYYLQNNEDNPQLALTCPVSWLLRTYIDCFTKPQPLHPQWRLPACQPPPRPPPPRCSRASSSQASTCTRPTRETVPECSVPSAEPIQSIESIPRRPKSEMDLQRSTVGITVFVRTVRHTSGSYTPPSGTAGTYNENGTISQYRIHEH